MAVLPTPGGACNNRLCSWARLRSSTFYLRQRDGNVPRILDGLAVRNRPVRRAAFREPAVRLGVAEADPADRQGRAVRDVRWPACSTRSNARASDAQARGVEKGTGLSGTGRSSASGCSSMNARISGRVWPRAQSSHSPMSSAHLQQDDAVDEGRCSGSARGNGPLRRGCFYRHHPRPLLARGARRAAAPGRGNRTPLHVRCVRRAVRPGTGRTASGFSGKKDARRGKTRRRSADDARDAADVLRARDLRADQRTARQPRRLGRLVNDVGLAHPRPGEQQNAVLVGHAADDSPWPGVG